METVLKVLTSEENKDLVCDLCMQLYGSLKERVVHIDNLQN